MMVIEMHSATLYKLNLTYGSNISSTELWPSLAPKTTDNHAMPKMLANWIVSFFRDGISRRLSGFVDVQYVALETVYYKANVVLFNISILSWCIPT